MTEPTATVDTDGMETTAEELAAFRDTLDRVGVGLPRSASQRLLRDFARLQSALSEAVRERDELRAASKQSRFLARFGEEMWLSAEKEITELKIVVDDLSNRALPPGEWVCFTRGRFDEMVKEKTSAEAALSEARKRAETVRAEAIEECAKLAEQGDDAKPEATAREIGDDAVRREHPTEEAGS